MTVTVRISPLLTPFAALGVAVLLAACSADADPADPADAGATSEVEATGDAAPVDGDGDGGGDGAQASGGLEGLFAEALHPGVDPAAPGTAYIEVEGERLEFEGVECTWRDEEDAEAVAFLIRADSPYGTTELSVSRSIGWGMGFEYEEELVQLTHLGGEINQISMAQNAGDDDGTMEWYRGDGPDPLLTVVGSDVVATGTLGRFPGSDDAQTGAFVMAANCG